MAIKKGELASDISAIVKELMDKEDRKDAEFRYALLSTEIGDIGKYITHDPALNPNARPHGSKGDEKLAYGQALAMLMALAEIRNINYAEALDLGISHWKEADWRKKIAQEKTLIRGAMINPRAVTASAYLLDNCHMLKDVKKLKHKHILVMKSTTPDIILAIENIAGLVADNGGRLCHAAIIARDYGLPCIVGTGNATSLIRNGDLLSMAPYGAPEEELGEVTISNKNYCR